jgi:hypothetical protein
MKTININTITQEEIERLAEKIHEADYEANYNTAKQIEMNKKLHEAGLTDADGVFYTNLTGKAAKVADALMDYIG